MTAPIPRRKSIPDAVKVQVLLRMLDLAGVKIDWSHEPALGLRAVNDAGTDYKPAQLDPAYIVARKAEEHDNLTFKDNGTGRSDLGAIAHVKRTVAAHAQHQARMGAKLTGKKIEEKRRGPQIHSRGFSKQHRQLRSRNDLRRRK